MPDVKKQSTPSDIREIHIDLDYLRGTHGSAVFTRGGTQSLAVSA